MRAALWPDEPEAELAREARRFFEGGVQGLVAVLIAHDRDDGPIGFAELNVRPYAEGCAGDRVAYLEGWYVEPAHRRRRVGAALVAACERWAAGRGIAEFASDALADNALSRQAHLALGFEEVEVIRCFRKDVR
jgi:aminoglycoside 6'-N-acetyltransferase I